MPGVLGQSCSSHRVPPKIALTAALASSAGFIAPETERENGAVTAATQDRDRECPFFSGGPALPAAAASRGGALLATPASRAGASPASRECAREVAAEDSELSMVKLRLVAESSSRACSAGACLAGLAAFRLSSVKTQDCSELNHHHQQNA